MRFESTPAVCCLFPLPFPPLLPSHPPNIEYVDAWLHHGFSGFIGHELAVVNPMRGATDGTHIPNSLRGWMRGLFFVSDHEEAGFGPPLVIRARSHLGGELLRD